MRFYYTAVLLMLATGGVTWGRPEPAHVLLAIVGITGVLSAQLHLRRIVAVPAVSWPLGLFLVFLLVSLVSHGTSPHSSLFAANLLAGLGLSGFLVAYLTNEERLRAVAGAYAVGAGFLGLLAVLSVSGYLPGGPFQPTMDQRAMPLAGDPNVFASYLVPASLFTVERYVRTTPRLVQRFWLGIGIAIASGMWLAASRGAWLGAFVAFAIYVAFTMYLGLRPSVRILKGLFVTHAVALLLVTLVTRSLPPTVATRSLPLARMRLYWYDNDRFAAMMSAFDIAREHPLLGVGPGRAGEILGYGTHNVFLQIAAEYGVVMLAAFIAVVVAITRWCVACPRANGGGAVPSRLAVGAALIGLMANGMFVDVLYWRVLWVLVGLGWAIVALQIRISPAHRG